MKTHNNGAMRNARFWEHLNGGWVKITLRPDQQRTWSRYEKDEEGYSAEAQTWEHQGSGVRNDWLRSGRDCDGHVRETGNAFCPLDDLAAVFVNNGPNAPHWKPGQTRRRDEFAEAAGY